MHFNVSVSAKNFQFQFHQNLTIFHFFLYEQISSSKKNLANFGAPARFHSISVTVESVGKKKFIKKIWITTDKEAEKLERREARIQR